MQQVCTCESVPLRTRRECVHEADMPAAHALECTYTHAALIQRALLRACSVGNNGDHVLAVARATRRETELQRERTFYNARVILLGSCQESSRPRMVGYSDSRSLCGSVSSRAARAIAKV